MTTGEEIRSARQRAGLTQQELATQLGVSMRTVGNWERGETVSTRHTARIAEVLRGFQPSAESPRPIEGFSDAAILAEIARRFDSTRSIRDRAAEQPQPDDPDPRMAREPLSDGATTRLSDRRPRLLGGEDPTILEMPFAADEDKPGDDPGEDDH